MPTASDVPTPAKKSSKKKPKKKKAAGEGSTWRQKNGHYRATVYVRGERVSKVFPSQAEAVAWKIATAAARDANTLSTAPAHTTVNDRIDVWLATRTGDVQGRTLSDYRGELDRLVRPGLGKFKLADLTPAKAKAWADGLALAGWSADKRRRAIGNAKTVLEADVGTLLPSNPLAKVKRPKQSRKPVAAFDQNQALNVLAACDPLPTLGPLVRLLMDAGCRPQEAFPLLVTDIDLTAGVLRITKALENDRGKLRVKEPKTRAGSRTVLLTPATCQSLAAHVATLKGRRAANGLLFPSRTGTLLQHQNVSKRWRAVCLAAGVPAYGLKSCRHTSASLLLGVGAHIKAVSQRLGHESIEITLRFYAAVLPTQQEQVRELAAKLFTHRATHEAGSSTTDQS